MAKKPVSVEASVKSAQTQADELVEALKDHRRQTTGDSFQNFGLNLGMGTDNALSDSTYGFNPITRQRTLLEWIHRGSWLGGVAVDLVADDMTRAGVEFGSTLKPADGDKLHTASAEMGIWEQLNDAIKWARLYGGAGAAMLIDGQRMDTPLRLKSISKNQFKGLYTFDRWMVEPSLSDLVTELGPNLGQPKFYTVNADAPALRGQKIHYSRFVRLEGTRLPWNQRAGENFWGLSVYERLYDRMVAFDSATQGAAQLVYKSALRTYKVFQMRELIGGDAQAQAILSKYVEMMRRFQSVEGITLIDANDDFVMSSSASFPGIAEALMQFGQQISGSLQIPLVRLFGQSPSGMNSSGESDLTTYYDGINHQQERWLGVPVRRIYRAIGASVGVPLDDEFSVKFRALWQLSDEKKGALAAQIATAVTSVEGGGIVSRATALKELKQSGRVTGLWTNISDEEIEEAENDPPPGPEGILSPDGEPLPTSPLVEVPEQDPAQPKPDATQKPVPGDPAATTDERIKPPKKPVHIHMHDAAGDDLSDDEIDSIAQRLQAVETQLITEALAKRQTELVV